MYKEDLVTIRHLLEIYNTNFSRKIEYGHIKSYHKILHVQHKIIVHARVQTINSQKLKKLHTKINFIHFRRLELTEYV